MIPRRLRHPRREGWPLSHGPRALHLTPSGGDVRKVLVQLQKKTSAAAVREELVTRNVATLVEPPRVEARDLSAWSLQETLDFLAASRKDLLYAAFVLAIALGFRRGEIVGLRWENGDLDKREIRVRTPRQRVGGEAYEDDPKGRRRRQTLPLPGICVAPLRWQRMKQAEARPRPGTSGRKPGTCSPPGPGGPSSRGTSTGASPAWPRRPG